VLVLTALAVGPLVSTVTPRAYFSSPDPYRYIATQGTFFFGWFNSLPGVWEHNPMLGINGSIWTLKYEAECYGLVLLLGVTGLLRKQVVLLLYVLVLAALVLFPGVPGTEEHLPDPNAHLDVGAAFLAGAVIQQWNVPLNGRIAAACLVVASIACVTGQMLWAQRTVVPYLALWLTLGLVATPLTLTCGWLSWHLVEKRALAFKATAPQRAVDRESIPNDRLRVTSER
jgi:peptidoglycan/LPS O-acetylase OafA/YrhL